MNTETDLRADNPRKARRPGGFWTGFISGIFGLVVVGGLLGFLLSPELLKHRSPFPLEAEIGESRISAAIDGSYKNKANPVALNEANVTTARPVFLGNCSVCHGATGKGDAPLGKGLFPPAANLLESRTVEKTDGELFWILENGLSFVGMPKFKDIISEQDMWKAVTYVRALQKGTATAVPANPAVSVTPTVIAVATTAAAANTTAAVAAPTTQLATTAAVATTAAAIAPTTAAGGDDVTKGLAVFNNQGCAGCHGVTATGGIGPKIANPAFPFEGLLRQIRSGGGAMPAYPAAQLPDGDARLIYAYLKSLK